MGAGKQTPRQKLIAMMYLLLTALLALNVSKDILEAFTVINEGIEHTNSASLLRMNRLYEEFKLAYNIDQKKVGTSWEKARQVRKQTNELLLEIDDLKRELIMKTEGVSREVADTLTLEYIERKEDYDVPTQVLIGNTDKVDKSKAADLRRKLEGYREELLAHFSKEKQEALEIPMALEGGLDVDGNFQPWEMRSFYYTPLVGCITILSKLQSDIRNAEYEVVNQLYAGIDHLNFKFDTIAAKVLAQSNYVLLGEEYQANVFLAAYNTTQEQQIIYEQSSQGQRTMDTSYAEKGLGNFTFKADKEGVHEWGGIIRMRAPDNRVMEFPFRSEYMVARPSSTVSADKMNVLYAGIKNPVSVSVPGIPSEYIQVSVSGGHTIAQKGKGKYEIDMNPDSPRIVKVSVKANMPNGEVKNMGVQEFRVKPLPKPYGSIGGNSAKFKSTPQRLLAMRGIRAKYGDDFVFNLPVYVSKFKMEIRRANGTIIPFEARGPEYSEQMKKAIKLLEKGDILFFEDIQAKGEDGKTKPIDPITVEII